MSTKLLLLFIGSLALVLCDLDPSIAKVVHKSGNSYLIRGNLPIKDNVFQNSELSALIESLTHLEEY